MQNSLIFGKSDIQNIVSVEADGANLIIYKEVAGKVVTEVIPNKYWFLTNKRISAKQKELAGDQHWKYLAEFDELEEQRKVRQLLRSKYIDKWDIWNTKESSLVYHGMTYYKGMKPTDVSILSFDLEADSLMETSKSEIYLITNTFRKNGKIKRCTFSLEDYENQADMLNEWCDWVRAQNPSIMCGHNIYGYDFRYLQHVAKINNTSLNLGRDGSEITFNKYTSKKRKDGTQEIEYTECFIYGREIVDTMFLSITFDVAKNFESYGLKPIIKHLGLEKTDRTFIDASKIRVYYKERSTNPEMWNNVKQYAEEDSDDALKLYDHMIGAYFYLTQSVSKSFQQMINSATGSQINNMMVRAYFQDGHSIAKTTESEVFEGGISLGIPGIYDNCLKWDLASAYPHTIIQFQLYEKKKDPKAYMLQMVRYFTSERLKNKKLSKETKQQYYEDLQQAQKVLINSFFGFCGAVGLNYNAPFIAAEITRKCRGYIQKAIEWATGKDVEYWKSLNGNEVNVE